MKTLGQPAGVLLLVLGLAACNERIAEPRPPEARIRLVHGAASTEALNLRIDGQVVLSGVAATEISNYAVVSAGDRDVAVTVTGSGQTLVSRSVTLEEDVDYSMLISGTLTNPEDMITSDSAFIPLPGKVKIRVIHAARSAPPLDVYLTTPGEDLSTALKLYEPFEFNVADTSVFPRFAERDPGDWQVRFTADGTTSVVLDTGPFATGGGQIITVVLSHDGNNDLVVRILDETPGVAPELAFLRVNHAAPGIPAVAVHVTEPGLDLNQPHLFISPFNYGVDSSTVTFMLPPNNQNNLDVEIRFTEVGTLNVVASSGAFSVPSNQGRLVTLQPKQGGGVEVVVTNEQ